MQESGRVLFQVHHYAHIYLEVMKKATEFVNQGSRYSKFELDTTN